ncbi:MAG: hypothetical protein Tsb0015_10800 [Simkaniaceae bacterium]
MNKIENIILKALKQSSKKAWETAACTNTALVYVQNGKIVKIKPPYRYELVPIKPSKRKKSSKK